MALAKQASNCSQGLLYSLRCPKSFLATRACVALCGGARCWACGMRHAAWVASSASSVFALVERRVFEKMERISSACWLDASGTVRGSWRLRAPRVHEAVVAVA